MEDIKKMLRLPRKWLQKVFAEVLYVYSGVCLYIYIYILKQVFTIVNMITCRSLFNKKVQGLLSGFSLSGCSFEANQVFYL